MNWYFEFSNNLAVEQAKIIRNYDMAAFWKV